MSSSEYRSVTDAAMADLNSIGASQPLSTPVQSSGKSRKGKGAKSKQAENHRTKQNIKGEQVIEKGLKDQRVTLGYSASDVLGDIISAVVATPCLDVRVATHKLYDLVNLTINTLYTACKLLPPAGKSLEEGRLLDSETMRFVSSYQLESKVYFAQTKWHRSLVSEERDSRARSTARLLDVTLAPLAIYLDQVGWVKVSEQTFVPFPYSVKSSFPADWFSERNESRLQGYGAELHADAVLLDLLGPTGRSLSLRVTNPQRAVELGIVQRVEDRFRLAVDYAARCMEPAAHGVVVFEEVNIHRPPDYASIVARYNEFVGRVNKRQNRRIFKNVYLGNYGL